MPEPVGFFLDENSEDCARVRKLLTSGPFRCNLMMVADAEQAAAILRNECEQAVPDLLLVYGGLHDGRAAALLDKIRKDARLNSIRFPVIVDNAQALQELNQQKGAASKLGAFELKSVCGELESGARRFWWVMARFS